ncbi:hypothetical protein B0H11DRAFT_1710581 [Mycena galericulata]|nr:hypothetical protein B0H11DRAFT_1710581 [Mycena galericulata]
MSSVLSQRPRRVLIIGGGPCGLVSLRNLIERGHFDEVVLVERREDVGGVWYLEDVPKPGTPRTRPFWPSPAYPGLVGNVLAEYLSFSHHPFPEPESTVHPYPSLADTYQYLRRFAAPFRSHIRLSTEVVWVDELPESHGWSVTTRDWRAGNSGETSVEVWDAVIVATSWYDHPSWPDAPGLVVARVAGLATHAQTWHGPVGYEGKRVVVVGNANSSNDIAAQLKGVAQAPVYRSIRRQSLRRFAFLPDPRVIDVPPIARYIVKSNRKLNLELLNGPTLTDIDAVILGTGYSAASAPFVRVLQRSTGAPNVPPMLTALTSAHTSPARIPALYRHILYAPNPTLAFIGAVMSYTPFTLADVASTWLALFFDARLGIPDALEARLAGERARLAQVESLREAGRAREGQELSSLVAYHILGADEQAYAQGLKDEVVRIAPEYKAVLPEWADADWKKREGMYERKWVSLMAERDAEIERKKRALL